MEYFRKMKGDTKIPPFVGFAEIFWLWIGAFLGIGAVVYLEYDVLTGQTQ